MFFGRVSVITPGGFEEKGKTRNVGIIDGDHLGMLGLLDERVRHARVDQLCPIRSHPLLPRIVGAGCLDTSFCIAFPSIIRKRKMDGGLAESPPSSTSPPYALN